MALAWPLNRVTLGACITLTDRSAWEDSRNLRTCASLKKATFRPSVAWGAGQVGTGRDAITHDAEALSTGIFSSRVIRSTHESGTVTSRTSTATSVSWSRLREVNS